MSAGPFRYAWFALPALGLVELTANAHHARRAPTLDEWRAVAPALSAARQQTQPVIVAPYWAEPLARHAFGDAAFPLAQLARPDDSAFTEVFEVSTLGARHEATRDWPVKNESRQGKFVLRTLTNPAPARVRWDLADGLRAARIRVEPGADCPWTDAARLAAGGLHGSMVFPAQRFQCAGSEALFVGVTILDDERYRPRRCVWAMPPLSGALVISVPAVPFGRTLRGHAGLSYFLHRDGEGAPLVIEASADGRTLGRVEHRDPDGWRRFEIDTTSLEGKSATLELRVSSAEPQGRELCIQVDTR